MAVLNLRLEGQLLTKQNNEVISSGDVNVDSCQFEFDDNWNGYTMTGVFYQDKSRIYYSVLDESDRCIVPAAAMQNEAPMYIGVFGINGKNILTSTIESINIQAGAISGGEVNLEPTDDIFLSIIANYRAILDEMEKHNATADSINRLTAEQNRILETLNAYDVTDVMARLESIEDKITSYKNTVEQILNREFIIRNAAIQFSDGVCQIENEFVNSTCICDVYFDEYSYEMAASALILATSCEGYIQISSSIDIKDKLTANILVRRY